MEFNFGLVVIVLVAYGFAVNVCWRNSAFSQPWKAIYALSFVPVLYFGMIFNIWFSEKYAPWLIHGFESAKYQRQQSMSALLIAAPVALIITYLWYRLLRKLDRATKKKE